MSGKLLMFAKLSLKSFIYTLTETLYFPDVTVREIYKKYQIDRILRYHILTDTDSTSLLFIAIPEASSDFDKSKVRDIIFEVIVKTSIYKRFDSSHPFWDNFKAQRPKTKQKIRLVRTEHIDNPCYVTLAVNPKEYFEFFEDYYTNKKHKGIKKGSRGMEFSNYSNGIKSLVNFDTFEKLPANDKRFYFPDSILSLPYGHPSLSEIDNFKRQKGQKIEKYFWEEKDNLLKMEKKALKKHTQT